MKGKGDDDVKRRLEIEDLLRYRFLSSLKASADKNSACSMFIRRTWRRTAMTAISIYTMHRQRGIRRLTDSGSAGSAIWLDQSHVLFASKEDLGAEPGKPVTEYFVMDIDSGESQFYMRIPAEVNWISDLGGGKFACLAKSYIPDEGGPEPKTAEKETWYHEERDYIIADELPFRQDGMGITNGMRYRVFVYDRKEDTLNAVSDKWQNVESINAKMGRSSSAREDFKNGTLSVLRRRGGL